MPIEIDKILAASPATTRGQATQLSCDPKGERIVYAVSRLTASNTIASQGTLELTKTQP